MFGYENSITHSFNSSKLQITTNTPEDFEDLLQILVIDDDEVDQMAIKRSLGKTSMPNKVHKALNAAQGIKLLQEQEFDCILLDFMLPDMNGLELLERIRFMGVRTPILVVTSQGDEQIAAKAIRLGAADYIPKSFLTPDGVYHSVKNAIRLHRAESEQRHTEEQLLATQSQLNLLISNLPMGIWSIDSNGIILFASGMALKMVGLKPSKIKGKHIEQVYQGLPGILERMKKALAGETIQAVDEIEGFFFKSVNMPTIDESGTVTGVSGFAFDITDSVLNERELVAAKELAEQSVRVKEQFIANISHEIRTPMNGIIGLTNVLQKTGLDQEQKKYLKAIQTSADNLMIIINDLLDFSKMAAESFAFDFLDFSVRELGKDLQLLMQQRVEERGNSFTLEVDPAIPEVIQGDPIRLRQILLNLIGNAAKFTEKGQIKLIVDLKEDRDEDVLLEFTVEDSGIGIPEEKLEAIFESFNQGSNDTTRKYGGTGLGLTISKSLVELQGGTIVVRSKPMAGSSFSFTLAFQKKAQSEIVNEPEEVEVPPHVDARLPLHILLAEDNMINQLLINKVLGDWNMDIKIVDNGKLAIEMIEKEKFDLILMDMQMPVMDGYEAIQRIRAMEGENAKLPIISLTAHAAASELDKCLAVGADAYVSKPFDPAELYRTIQRLTALEEDAEPIY